jgi:hypothetical protein
MAKHSQFYQDRRTMGRTFFHLAPIPPPTQRHTVAIWTFAFHEKSGYLVVDLEGKFQTSLEAKLINFLN